MEKKLKKLKKDNEKLKKELALLRKLVIKKKVYFYF
jgi:hypothetical protein